MIWADLLYTLDACWICALHWSIRCIWFIRVSWHWGILNWGCLGKGRVCLTGYRKLTYKGINVVKVGRNGVERIQVTCKYEVNRTDFLLTNINEQDWSRIDDTLEHRNNHDDQEDCENANFNRRWLLSHLCHEVLGNWLASGAALFVFGFKHDFFYQYAFLRLSHRLA